MGPHRFLGRRYAGKLLATRLEVLRDANALVIALSPGGVIVGDAIAIALGARLALWGTPSPDVRSRTVIAVDDGITSPEPTRAILRAMRLRAPIQIVVATPVGDRASLYALRAEAEVVALQIEDELHAVASRYQSFREITEDEARDLVENARARSSADSTRKLRVYRHSSNPPPG